MLGLGLSMLGPNFEATLPSRAQSEGNSLQIGFQRIEAGVQEAGEGINQSKLLSSDGFRITTVNEPPIVLKSKPTVVHRKDIRSSTGSSHNPKPFDEMIGGSEASKPLFDAPIH